MPSKFTQQELYQDDIYGNLTKSLQKSLAVMRESEVALKKQGDTLSKLATTVNNSAKGVAKLTQANKKSKAALTEQEKIVKKIAIAEQELKTVTDAQRKSLQSLSLEKKKANQLAKEQAILESKLSTEFEKEQVRLKRLEKAYKDALLVKGKDAKETKRLGIEHDKLARKLDKVNVAVNKSKSGLKTYGQGLKGAVGGLKNFAAALGVVAGVQLFTRALRDAFNVIKNFDQAQADLSSVLGVNREEMSELTEQAKLLGSSTEFTASQVSELSLEFAKLGFTQKEILAVTEATLSLASAAGTDLANAATIVGSTLRGFGLEASDTQRLVDVMAKSFSSSSLDIDKFASAMSNVAPAAAAMGFTIEETTALLGTLTDAGVDASSAGTGLRNMFLNAKAAGLTFDEALDMVANSTDKLGTSFDIFKKKGSTLGVILAANRDKTAELTETLDDAAGAAKEMADKQLDTLNGSLKLLNSAWEGFILGADGSAGASEKLKDIIKFLADNLEEILAVIGRTILAWGTYKIAIKAAQLATSAFGKKLVASLGPVGIAIAVIVVALKGVFDAITNVDVATQKLNERNKNFNESLDEEIVKLQAVTRELLAAEPASKERGKIIDELNRTYGTYIENLRNEDEVLRQLANAYKRVVSEMRKRIGLEVISEEMKNLSLSIREAERAIRTNSDEFGLYAALLPELKKELEKSEKDWKDLNAVVIEGARVAGKARKSMDDLQNAEKELGEEVEETTKSFKEQNDQITAIISSISTVRKEIEEFDNENKKRNKARTKDAKEVVSEIIEIEEEIGDLESLLEDSDLTIEAEDIFSKTTLDDLKKSFSIAAQLAQDAANFRIRQLEREQEAARENIQASQTEQARLRSLGTAEAAEALIAEKKKEAAEKKRISDLEKRKKSLLIAIVALERVNQLIQSGDGDPFGKASAEISSFLSSISGEKSLNIIDGLPTFFEGTTTDVQAALGNPNLNTSKDNYLIRAHGTEAILNGGQYDSITRANGYKLTTDEITRRAMMNVNRPIYRVPDSQVGQDSNRELINSNKAIEKAIKKIKTTIIEDKLIREIQGNSEKVIHRTNGFIFG